MGLGAVVALAFAISSGLSRPVLAVYDVEAPIVSVSSPVTGSQVVKGSTVEIVVDAYDNVGVTQVDFYVNNRLVCSGAAGTCMWQVPTKRNDTYNVEVRAYDAVGNMGVARAVYTAL